MLRQTCAVLITPRAVGQYGRGGTYNNNIFSAGKHAGTPAPEHVPYGAEHMKDGETYAPSGPRTIARVERKIPTNLGVKTLAGLTDKMIPWDLLDINLVFKTIEPGNIVPQPYTAELTEPVSADPEKHPVPTMFWIHKWNKVDAPSSYGLVPETDFVTEGRDRNPFAELGRNPGVLNWRQSRQKTIAQRGNKVRKAMLYPGYKKPNQNLWTHRLSSSPWWYKAEEATLRVEGRGRIDSDKTPTFAYYKFLPILGWAGWGTKQGEINVEGRYTEVGSTSSSGGWIRGCSIPTRR